jgi:hypothetical protein
MDMDYKEKILKYKQKYLNLKNNTMKGGVRMEIVLTKNADGTINFSLPPNFSSAAPGTYRIELVSESVASPRGSVAAPTQAQEIVRVASPRGRVASSEGRVASSEGRVASSEGRVAQAQEIVRVTSPGVEIIFENYSRLINKIREYLSIFTKSEIDKIKLNENLTNIWNDSVARSIFIYLMTQILDITREDDEWENIFMMLSSRIQLYSEFLFFSHDQKYNWIRQHDRWSSYQRELNKILDYPERNKGIIDSFKTIFNELIMFCIKT